MVVVDVVVLILLCLFPFVMYHHLVICLMASEISTMTTKLLTLLQSQLVLRKWTVEGQSLLCPALGHRGSHKSHRSSSRHWPSLQ